MAVAPRLGRERPAAHGAWFVTLVVGAAGVALPGLVDWGEASLRFTSPPASPTPAARRLDAGLVGGRDGVLFAVHTPGHPHPPGARSPADRLRGDIPLDLCCDNRGAGEGETHVRPRSSESFRAFLSREGVVIHAKKCMDNTVRLASAH